MASERRSNWSNRFRALVRAIEDNDQAAVEAAILRLSQRRRIFAPLGLVIGAFVMLFDGVKLLVTNWRLTLVQVLPAMWIYLAMFDLKLHVLHGKSFHPLRGAVLIPINLAIISITIAAFFLNAVFAFAVARKERPPQVRPAMADAKAHIRSIAQYGAVVGLMLGFATTVVTRWGRPWFSIALGIVIAIMMITYVAVPTRLIGGEKPAMSRRDKLSATVLGGLLSTAVCTPPYVIARIGVLMLGSSVLFIPGLFVLAFGTTLQAGATGAVRAVKMSVTLTGAQSVADRAPAR
jgi:magnesium-transporting ATPase (P-type)